MQNLEKIVYENLSTLNPPGDLLYPFIVRLQLIWFGDNTPSSAEPATFDKATFDTSTWE